MRSTDPPGPRFRLESYSSRKRRDLGIGALFWKLSENPENRHHSCQIGADFVVFG